MSEISIPDKLRAELIRFGAAHSRYSGEATVPYPVMQAILLHGLLTLNKRLPGPEEFPAFRSDLGADDKLEALLGVSARARAIMPEVSRIVGDINDAEIVAAYQAAHPAEPSSEPADE